MAIFPSHGRQKGHTEIYRGRDYTVDPIPSLKLEMVLADNIVDTAAQIISQTAHTGKIGAGKIFLARIDDAIRICNDDRGENALELEEDICSRVGGLLSFNPAAQGATILTQCLAPIQPG